MNQELGVDSIATLRQAAEDDSIAGLKVLEQNPNKECWMELNYLLGSDLGED